MEGRKNAVGEEGDKKGEECRETEGGRGRLRERGRATERGEVERKGGKCEVERIVIKSGGKSCTRGACNTLSFLSFLAGEFIRVTDRTK